MFLVACYTVLGSQPAFLEHSIKAIYDSVDAVCINASFLNWWGEYAGDRTTDIAKRLIEDEKMERIGYDIDEWSPQERHRKGTVELAKSLFPQMTHGLQLDADEAYAPEDVEALKNIMAINKEPCIAVPLITFWKNFNYRILPIRKHCAVGGFRWHKDMKFNRRGVVYPHPIRKVSSTECKFFHFSYVRKTNDEIKSKIESFSHRSEVVSNWYENVWLKWEAVHRTGEMNNLHPTHPELWPVAVKIPMDDLPKNFQTLEPYCREDFGC